MRRALSCTMLTLSACSCESTTAQTTADVAAEASGDPAPETNAAPPSKNTFVPPSADEFAELATALAGHLSAARDATDAMTRRAALERAVHIVPFDTATLAQLGRAHADGGLLVEAARVFELAVRHADEAPTKAALLVELGAVREAMGNPSRAAELYQSSIALHSTELATARLAALTGAEILSHDACAWTRHGPAPTELCPAYVQDAAPSTCTYEHPPLVLDAQTKVEVFSHLDPSTAIEVYVVNVILGGVWFSSPLTWVSHPEVEHADENLARLELRLEQLAPDRKPQVVIEWQLERRAIDPANGTLETRLTSNLGVLSVGAGEPRWWLGLRTASSRMKQQRSDASEPTSIQTGVKLKWAPKTGEFEVLRTEHSPSTMLGEFALGTYPLLCPSEIDAS
jgi:tetratricopeptide (TPR) repeat protein